MKENITGNKIQQTKSATRAASLPDSGNPLRKAVLGKFLARNLDYLDFYDFGSRLARIPVLGSVLFRAFLNHYGQYFQGGVVQPLREILTMLDAAKDLVVSECACRVRTAGCATSTRTCIKVNTGARLEAKLGRLNSEPITAEEAKAIVTKNAEAGMILFAKWLPAPYIYAICSCCPCCCLARKLRFERDIQGAMTAGEYMPRHAPEKCAHCGECVSACPADAIIFQRNVFTVDLKKCVGCGLCERACGKGAVALVRERRTTHVNDPGVFVGTYVYLTNYFILYPLIFLFTFTRGRRRRKRDFDWASEKQAGERV